MDYSLAKSVCFNFLQISAVTIGMVILLNVRFRNEAHQYIAIILSAFHKYNAAYKCSSGPISSQKIEFWETESHIYHHHLTVVQ